ncbi:hypothetical protein F0231_20170 [Vibrio sp. RE86]|nr:hypothetical protein [Vibrio sp. RE86]
MIASLHCGSSRTWSTKYSTFQSHNKAFKSDSQRLAFSLRSSVAKRCSHLNAALCDRSSQQNS